MSCAIGCTSPRAFSGWSVVSVAVHGAVLAAVAVRARRPAVARRVERRRPVMTISLGGGGEGRERRHDGDRRTAGPGGDAARARKARSGSPAGREDAGDDGAESRRRSRRKARRRRRSEAGAGRGARPNADARRRDRRRAARSPTPARAARASASRPAAAPGSGSYARRRELLLSRLPGADDRAHPRELESQQAERRRRPSSSSSRFSATARSPTSRSSSRAATPTLDLRAQRAVWSRHDSLPPLPAHFPNPTLTVHLNFQYQR